MPDKNHIHHKILALGFDHYEAVFMIYVVQALLVTLAYVLRFESDVLIMLIYVAFCLFVAGGFYIALRNRWYLARDEKSLVSQVIALNLTRFRGGGAQQLAETIVTLVSVAVPLYLLAGTLLVTQVSADISILATITLVFLLFTSFRAWSQSFGWTERAGTYITATFVVYLMNQSSGIIAHTQFIQNLVFVLLALAVVVGFRYSKDRTFQMTPLDFIVIFAAFAVPSISQTFASTFNLNDSIAKLIILFYSIELLLTNVTKRWDLLRVFVYLPLAVLGIRGVV
jgi:UDP-GlcNAc:undecaprenyl-phosphate GlcNAc-1-phosphate transferase